MRLIRKRPEPAAFLAWKALANQEWSPTFDDLQNPEKAILKASLLEEQGYVCCYCERRISSDDSHVEHLVPQADDGDLALDYGNLLASCQPEKPAAPPCCGQKKGDRSLPVHPLMPDCSDYFVFLSSGYVKPTKDPTRNPAAKRAIQVLALDGRSQTEGRKKAIEALLPLLESDPDLELPGFQASVLGRDGSGMCTPYATAISQFLATYL